MQADPEVHRFCLLTDTLCEGMLRDDEPFTTIRLDELGMPGGREFLYRYSILELNTSVKPAAILHLFGRWPSIQRIIYLDPDIQVFSRLKEAWNALEHDEIVVTPHLRRPFNDGKWPTELAILQGGTFNLGFIGFKRCANATSFLEWWSEKLYLDCIVDPKNGIFTDQRWMEFVTSYSDRVRILRHPGYNCAYWNLHERSLSIDELRISADGTPLRFFHFSGYSPLRPQSLSRHQDRHDLRDLPVLRRLCDEYAQRLIEEGFHQSQRIPYEYSRLGNGVDIGPATWCVRFSLRNGLAFPSPAGDPEGFCRWLMRANAAMPGGHPPLAASILATRPDLVAAFPGAVLDAGDKAFIEWLHRLGRNDLGIETLLERYWRYWQEPHPLQRLLSVVQDKKTLLSGSSRSGDIVEGVRAMVEAISAGLTPALDPDGAIAAELPQVGQGPLRIINLYFARPDLQKLYLRLHRREVVTEFCRWLAGNLAEIDDIQERDIHAFALFTEFQPQLMLVLNAAYNQRLRELAHCAASIFDLDSLVSVLIGDAEKQARSTIESWLLSTEGPPPLAQLEAHWHAQAALQRDFPRAFIDGEGLQQLCMRLCDGLPAKAAYASWKERLISAVSASGNAAGVTLGGYFGAPTGMGQSARALLQTISAAGVPVAAVSIPTLPCGDPQLSAAGPLLFGWPGSQNRLVIIDANADHAHNAMQFLPQWSMKGRTRIGYWVWETDELPCSQAVAAGQLHQIWTPSQYSAQAIARHVRIPVRVLPHALDLDRIDAAMSQSRREEFAISEDKLIVGFCFDGRSNLERKNPHGLLRAFRAAMRPEDNAMLLLKVHGVDAGSYEWQRLRVELEGPDVRLIDRTLTRDETLRLIACCDVYASLHRAEGFGLTMAEAMAMGVAVMATRHSGNLEFMTDDDALLVDCTLVPTERPYGPYPRGTIWAQVDQAAAVQALRTLSDASFRIELGRRAQTAIRARLSPQAAAARYRELAFDLLVHEHMGVE